MPLRAKPLATRNERSGTGDPRPTCSCLCSLIKSLSTVRVSADSARYRGPHRGTGRWFPPRVSPCLCPLHAVTVAYPSTHQRGVRP